MMDKVLIEPRASLLTEEEFRTVLPEETRIVNSTVLWTVSDSASEPTQLTPGMILNTR